MNEGQEQTHVVETPQVATSAPTAEEAIENKEEVVFDEETKTFYVWQTDVHRYRVSKGVLEQLRESRRYPTNLLIHVQKAAKITSDGTKGELWVESINAIWNAVQNHVDENL